MLSFLLGKYLAVSYDKHILICLRNGLPIFQSGRAVPHSHQQDLSSTSLHHLVWPAPLILSILSGQLHLIMDLFPSPSSLMVLSALLSEVSVKIFGPFFNGVASFLNIELESSFYIPDTSPLLNICFVSVSLLVCGLPFHSLNSVFQREEAVNLDDIPGKSLLSVLPNALCVMRFSSAAYGNRHLPNLGGCWALFPLILSCGFFPCWGRDSHTLVLISTRLEPSEGSCAHHPSSLYL